MPKTGTFQLNSKTNLLWKRKKEKIDKVLTSKNKTGKCFSKLFQVRNKNK